MRWDDLACLRGEYLVYKFFIVKWLWDFIDLYSGEVDEITRYSEYNDVEDAISIETSELEAKLLAIWLLLAEVVFLAACELVEISFVAIAVAVAIAAVAEIYKAAAWLNNFSEAETRVTLQICGAAVLLLGRVIVLI